MAKADKYIERGPRLVIPKKDKKGVLRTLDAIRALFGKKGENWIQGDFKDKRRTRDGKDIHTFCLVGAARQANGKYEPQAHAALALAMEQHFADDHFDVDDDESADTVIIRGNDEFASSWGDIAAVIKKAKALVAKV